MTAHRHEASYHDGPKSLVAAAVPFLSGGLDSGDAVVAVCSDATTELLEDALDGDSRVALLGPSLVQQRPSLALDAYRRVAEAEVDEGAARVRLLVEVEAGSQPATWSRWEAFEAVSNHALADCPLWIRCLYDTTRLPTGVLEAGRRTHPWLAEGGSPPGPNDRYLPPAEALRRLTPESADRLEAEVPALALTGIPTAAAARQALRAFVDTGAAGATRSADELIAAVSEAVTNALSHGAAPVSLRLWVAPDRMVCTVHDAGPGFADPLLGYAKPDLSRPGNGLWLMRRLCDSVETHRSAAGFTVELATRVTS